MHKLDLGTSLVEMVLALYCLYRAVQAALVSRPVLRTLHVEFAIEIAESLLPGLDLLEDVLILQLVVGAEEGRLSKSARMLLLIAVGSVGGLDVVHFAVTKLELIVAIHRTIFPLPKFVLRVRNAY